MKKITDYFNVEDIKAGKATPFTKWAIHDIAPVDNTDPKDGSDPQQFYTVTVKRMVEDPNDLSSTVVTYKKPVYERTHPGVFAAIEQLLASKKSFDNAYLRLQIITLNSKIGYTYKVDGKDVVYRSDYLDSKAGDKVIATKHTFVLLPDADNFENMLMRQINRTSWVSDPRPSDMPEHEVVVN